MAIRLTWTDNSNNETGFELTRETQSGANWGGSVSFNIGSNVSSYDDPINVPGTYRYRIRAFNATGTSTWTTYAQATVVEPIPTAPSNLVATVL